MDIKSITENGCPNLEIVINDKKIIEFEVIEDIKLQTTVPLLDAFKLKFKMSNKVYNQDKSCSQTEIKYNEFDINIKLNKCLIKYKEGIELFIDLFNMENCKFTMNRNEILDLIIKLFEDFSSRLKENIYTCKIKINRDKLKRIIRSIGDKNVRRSKNSTAGGGRSRKRTRVPRKLYSKKLHKRKCNSKKRKRIIKSKRD